MLIACHGLSHHVHSAHHTYSASVMQLPSSTRRVLRFSSRCLSHSSPLIRFVSLHAILNAIRFSFLGRNFSYCMNRYDMCLHDIFNGTFATFIHVYVRSMYNTATSDSVEFLLELIKLRDGMLVLT